MYVHAPPFAVLPTQLTPIVIALPLYILASLTLTAREKRGVAFICLLALMSISTAVIRFVAMDLRGAYDVDGNIHKAQKDKFYWTMVLTWLEIATVEIAFVLPALRMVLVDRARKRGSQGKEFMMVSHVKGSEDDVLVDREEEVVGWESDRGSWGR
jgi:hypothetical protein